MSDTLSPGDLASVDAAVDELARRGWKQRLSVIQLIEGWSSLVDEIERGYGQCLYELENDLSIREYTELVMELASPRVAAHLWSRLAPIDDRYRNTTTQVSRGSPPGAPD